MKIVIKTTDGGVAIMTLVSGSDEAQVIEKWKLANPEKYVSHRQMPDSAIPTDRTFRAAWADITPELTIDIDMAKAAYVPPEPAPAPTKEQLMAQLAALSAQIQALE
jgi:hypothetical protein